ncbi:MAG: hypothetical protein NTU95_09900 [Methanothrix sp.]|nr:hypothetical protein [Methanothrix sp.]
MKAASCGHKDTSADSDGKSVSCDRICLNWITDHGHQEGFGTTHIAISSINLYAISLRSKTVPEKRFKLPDQNHGARRLMPRRITGNFAFGCCNAGSMSHRGDASGIIALNAALDPDE